MLHARVVEVLTLEKVSITNAALRVRRGWGWAMKVTSVTCATKEGGEVTEVLCVYVSREFL